MALATTRGMTRLSYCPGHTASRTVARNPAITDATHTGTVVMLSPDG